MVGNSSESVLIRDNLFDSLGTNSITAYGFDRDQLWFDNTTKKPVAWTNDYNVKPERISIINNVIQDISGYGGAGAGWQFEGIAFR